MNFQSRPSGPKEQEEEGENLVDLAQDQGVLNSIKLSALHLYGLCLIELRIELINQ